MCLTPTLSPSPFTNPTTLPSAWMEPIPACPPPPVRRQPTPNPCAQAAPHTPEKRVVARPGVPAPTRLSAFVVADRPSPPARAPDKDGHYVFELGENISSRCEFLPSPLHLPFTFTPPWTDEIIAIKNTEIHAKRYQCMESTYAASHCKGLCRTAPLASQVVMCTADSHGR